jgi:hypothetical protein
MAIEHDGAAAPIAADVAPLPSNSRASVRRDVTRAYRTHCSTPHRAQMARPERKQKKTAGSGVDIQPSSSLSPQLAAPVSCVMVSWVHIKGAAHA